MRKKGFTLIELLVVVAIIAMLLAILLPALGKVKLIAEQLLCGTNLKGLGTSLNVYAFDYDDEFVVQGQGAAHTWDHFTAGWQSDAKDWSQPDPISVAASLYILIREVDVEPKNFVCKSSDQKPYEGENKNNVDLVELWDFGKYVDPGVPAEGTGPMHGAKGHVSYAYHMPYDTEFSADGSSGSAFAIMADKNPWFDPLLTQLTGAPTDPATWRDEVGLIWNNVETDIEDPAVQSWKNKVGNSYTHMREGQNVLFGDGHVTFERQPDVGQKSDNIYTYNDDSGTTYAFGRIGIAPAGVGDTDCLPLNENDSILVNDDN